MASVQAVINILRRTTVCFDSMLSASHRLPGSPVYIGGGATVTHAALSIGRTVLPEEPGL